MSQKYAPVPKEGNGYSLGNAVRFGWSSVTGNLHPERVATLDKFLLGNRILDAGCGGGAYVKYLREKGLDVTGVEKNLPFLKAAEERGISQQIISADITALPFGDKTFDTVYCFDVLEHVDDRKALNELVRVAKKRVIVTVPRDNSQLQTYGIAFSTYTDLTHLRYYSNESLLKLLSQFPSTKVSIFDEIPIDMKRLVLNALYFQRGPKIFSYLLTKLFRQMIKLSVERKYCAGIVGIIDLER